MNPPDDLDSALAYANNAAFGFARATFILDKANAKKVLSDFFASLIGQYETNFQEESTDEQQLVQALSDALESL